MKRVDQIVDRGPAVLFRNVAQVRVAGCCRGVGVAEKGLNMTEA